MRRPPRTAWTALVGLLASGLVVVGTAAPASAEEVAERPADGVFSIEGHGWGHGRGMSQWGAQGAASQGVSAETIVSTYYPGTARTVLAPAPIRVKLMGDEGTDLQVHAASGLKVTDTSTGTTQELPAGPTRWRVTVDSAGLHVQSLTGSTWTPYALGGGTTSAGPVRFSGPTFVRVAFPDGTSRDYRGAVQAVKTAATALASIVVLPLEDYLLGVVPREASSGWKPAALQAQSIAARSYSANKRERVAGTGIFDICDTTQCQVFGGSRLYTANGTVSELEPASTTEAVRATAGVVRTYEGTSIFAEFSSSNGGWSTKGDFSYLVAKRDDWDGAIANPVHSWKATLRASDLERRFPAVGTLRRIKVTSRDGNGEWGGRVKTVVLEGVSSTGAATSVSTTGAGVYNAKPWPGSSDGLRSSWWRVVSVETGSAVTAQSAAPTLVRPPGASTGSLTATLKNTGATAWPVAGLHLAVASPPGQADPLAGGSTRPGAFVRASRAGATTVSPGETAEFAIRLDAAGVQPGAHGRAYRLRVGDGPVFGATVSWRVQVDAALLTAVHASVAAAPGAAPATAGGPAPVLPDGRTVVVPRNGRSTVRWQLKNTGNLGWPAGGPVQLGTSGPRNRVSTSAGSDWLSTSRPTRLLAATAPGATGAFDLVLHGAGRPVGVTAEAFEPLWAGHGWIEGAARTFDVVRVDPAVSRLAMLHAGPAAKVTLQRDTTLVVRLRNLGGSPWQIGTERLATAADAPYALATSAWTSPSRPPALAANVVRPGATAVHPGEVGEWRIPLSALRKAAGTHRLVLQAVNGSARYGPQISTDVTVPASRTPVFKGSGPRYVGVG
jgi:SpoIID/LytB domain protein